MPASMRPRHKAAEYLRRLVELVIRHDLASMRPRHKAAEYAVSAAASPRTVSRFNEAAA